MPLLASRDSSIGQLTLRTVWPCMSIMPSGHLPSLALPVSPSPSLSAVPQLLSLSFIFTLHVLEPSIVHAGKPAVP